MSRIGKKPILIPENITIELKDSFIVVKGPLGELKQEIHPLVKIIQEGKELKVRVENEKEKKQCALWGLFQRLITNMIDGVIKGFEKKLEIQGVGYKASLKDNLLILEVGFSHSVEYKIPEGIKIKVEKNIVTIFGIDKQKVGEVAAQIRAIKKPEVYKGTGIRYFGEKIKLKPGKAAKAISAGTK